MEPDDDSLYHILHIASTDKQLILACPIDSEQPYLISKGKIFQNQPANGVWNRYVLPFEIPEIITPSFVAATITWATQENRAERIT